MGIPPQRLPSNLQYIYSECTKGMWDGSVWRIG